jgi:formyl-CoA transferase
MSSGLLPGVTVVEYASCISGPSAGLLLAQLGADVVKVEAPGSGAPFRRWGGTSPGQRTRPQFPSLNYGKRTVAIDLREPDGRVAYLQPVSGADALIENCRPGTLDGLGVGEAAVWEWNRDTVYCTVTGVGSTGPYAKRPAYGAIVQAVSRLCSLLSPVSDRQALGPPLSDAVAALNTALAVIAGLAGGARGRGEASRRCDVSMLAPSLDLVGLSVANYADSGEVAGVAFRGAPTALDWPYLVPRATCYGGMPCQATRTCTTWKAT